LSAQALQVFSRLTLGNGFCAPVQVLQCVRAYKLFRL